MIEGKEEMKNQIRTQIQIAPLNYYEYKVRERNPGYLSDRIKRDGIRECDLRRVRKNNFKSITSTKYGDN